MAVAGEDTGHLTGDRSVASTPQALADRRELTFIAVERTRMPMIISDPRKLAHENGFGIAWPSKGGFMIKWPS